jgi:hypothetical protein
MSYFKIAVADQRTAPEGYAELSPAEASALAQLLKRITFSDLESCAIDKEEAYLMVNAIERLQSAMATAGYDLR